MNNKLALFLAASSVPLCLFSQNPTVKRPNILIFETDDMTFTSLGVTGCTIEGISPNLDKLAKEGLLITRGYNTTALCGPSRNSLFTGMHPMTNGYLGHGPQPPLWWENEFQQRKPIGLTQYLREIGYYTALVCKNASRQDVFDFTDPSSFVAGGRDPKKFGEVTSMIVKNARKANKPFLAYINSRDPHLYWPRTKQETLDWAKDQVGPKKNIESRKLYPNGLYWPDPLVKYAPEEAMVMPAHPDEPALREEIRHYYDAVNRMDQAFGEVMNAMKREGVSEDLLIIFLSDNGIELPWAKRSIYDLGTRTPIIIRWKGHVKPKQVNDKSVVSTVDMVPTILDIVGVQPKVKPDGISFKCLLDGKNNDWKRKYAFCCFNFLNLSAENAKIATYNKHLYQNDREFRPSRGLHDNKFSYVFHSWDENAENTIEITHGGPIIPPILRDGKQNDLSYPNYKERYKTLIFPDREELYDNNNDPGCLHNLIDKPEFQARKMRFREEMIKQMQDVNDFELENYKAYIISKP